MAKKEAVVIEDDGLVEITKDGEILRAHPDQVPLWLTQGWTVVE